MTPDQSEFLVQADEGVAAAKLLLKHKFPAFSVSRAYYAMFTAAEAILLSKELSFSRHSAVIAAFGRHFAKKGIIPKKLYRAILAAPQDRQAADYGSGKRIGRTEAEQHIRNAEEFVRSVRAYLETEGGAKDR